MVLLYNLIQIPALILFSPFLFVKAIITARYRKRIPARLGLGLARQTATLPPEKIRIWVHALSVGEVTSSLPLVRALRANYPEALLLFSATTKTGEELARKSLSGAVNLFIPFPLDIVCITARFLRLISPDLFILVETDFWPNFLTGLRRRKIPTMLVNGRISEKSHGRHLRFSALFRPLFSCFSLLSMQTEADAAKMRELGVAHHTILPLGNLKYDAFATAPLPSSLTRRQLSIPEGRIVWIAGSTHQGEEEIILDLFTEVRRGYPALFLIIAPRSVERAGVVCASARRAGLRPHLRSSPQIPDSSGDIMILDTMGELASLYAICDLAFVGGSLVAAGGHNPLEPAAHGRPVLFGPHMEDFTEIAGDLVRSGGALQCADPKELRKAIDTLLADPALLKKTGDRARDMVRRGQGVVGRHLRAIGTLISPAKEESDD